MLELIKYELRANALTILIICATVIIANLILMIMGDSGVVPVQVISASLLLGAIIVIFIYSLKIMSKYLYEESGNLLFAHPQSGISIMTSRLVTALIQIFIVSLVSLLMFYLNVPNERPSYLFEDFELGVIAYNAIGYIWVIVYSITLIYFCMVIGKVVLKGKKIGKIGAFIIFIIISVAIVWLSTKIATIIPQNLNLSDFSVTSDNKVLNSDFMSSRGAYTINIATAIFDISTFAGLFITTSYLIDKKLNLS